MDLNMGEWTFDREHWYLNKGDETQGVTIKTVDKWHAYGNGKFLGKFDTDSDARGAVEAEIKSSQRPLPSGEN